MDARGFQASHRVHAYCVQHHAKYREQKERAMGMIPGTLSKNSAQNTLQKHVAMLDPSAGLWYQECAVEGVSFLVYTGKGTKYPDPASLSASVLAVVEVDCNDVEHEEHLFRQCTEQLALQPVVHWYTAQMAAKHIEFLHALLQTGFVVKETLAKLPADPLSSVLLIIHGYRS